MTRGTRTAQPPVRLLGDAPEEGQAVLAPLTGSTALVTAVAPDGLGLRRRMLSRKPPRERPVRVSS
ncbi:hypothetical protein ACWC2K_20260 [Streptomyces chattanoogensis]|uniref:hypothetical protein n=1 Tax=Streptomyces chattanoogensis TaxID=66876 RepID=UPI0036AC204A